MTDQQAETPDIIILEPEDKYINKARIDLSKDTVFIYNEKESTEYLLSQFNKVRLKSNWAFRWGLHMVVTYVNAGGYTDHYVTLEGDAGTYPLQIGDDDVSYTEAYKNAVKIAVHTKFPLYNDVKGEVEDEPVLGRALDFYPSEELNDISPVAPTFESTDNNKKIFDLPRLHFAPLGLFCFILIFIFIDLFFPIVLFETLTAYEGDGNKFLVYFVLATYAPAMILMPYYFALKLYTRVRITIEEEKVVVEKRFFFMNEVRNLAAQDITRVYLKYDSTYGGHYGDSLLYRKKKTPPIIIVTTYGEVRFGAGLDYGKLKYLKLAIKEVVGKYSSKE